MKILKILIPAALSVYLGCMSSLVKSINLPLKEGNGTYQIDYMLYTMPPGPYYNSWYAINTELLKSNNLLFLDFKSVNIIINLYEKEISYNAAKISKLYALCFYRNTGYSKAPDVSLTIDDKKFKLPYRHGRTKTISSVNKYGRSSSESTDITYGLPPDVIMAMKTMKKISISIGRESRELDAETVARTRSFMIDSMGFDYQSFAQLLTEVQ